MYVYGRETSYVKTDSRRNERRSSPGATEGARADLNGKRSLEHVGEPHCVPSAHYRDSSMKSDESAENSDLIIR
jgi:hypothetical protein